MKVWTILSVEFIISESITGITILGHWNSRDEDLVVTHSCLTKFIEINFLVQKLHSDDFVLNESINFSTTSTSNSWVLVWMSIIASLNFKNDIGMILFEQVAISCSLHVNFIIRINRTILNSVAISVIPIFLIELISLEITFIAFFHSIADWGNSPFAIFKSFDHVNEAHVNVLIISIFDLIGVVTTLKEFKQWLRHVKDWLLSNIIIFHTLM